MLNQLNNYYFSLSEPDKSCCLFLRHYLLNYSTSITEHWKYSTPFFMFNNKLFCYFSISKKRKQPYIGFVLGYKIQHPKLVAEDRKQIRVFYIDSNKDIDITALKAILKMASKLY